MSTPFDYDVFLSHNRQDKPRVRKLAERLRESGLRVWFDDWIIRPGDDIFLAVEHGLQTSRTLILCLSPAALGSDWVGLERSTVLFRDPSNRDRRFIPLLLTDCDLPDTLRRYKYVDYRAEGPEAFEELLVAKNLRHLEYRVRQPGDVYLVIRDSEGTIRWMNVTAYLKQRRDKTSRQIVFAGEELTGERIRLFVSPFVDGLLPWLALKNPRKLIETPTNRSKREMDTARRRGGAAVNPPTRQPANPRTLQVTAPMGRRAPRARGLAA